MTFYSDILPMGLTFSTLFLLFWALGHINGYRAGRRDEAEHLAFEYLTDGPFAHRLAEEIAEQLPGDQTWASGSIVHAYGHRFDAGCVMDNALHELRDDLRENPEINELYRQTGIEEAA